jgi:PilZ domain-containing protein
MTTSPLRVERRVGQRFSFLLPMSFCDVASGMPGVGFTQDLSSRGVFFFTETALQEGAEIELTLVMPSEITLGESMHVRCRGHILRVVRRSDQGLAQSSVPAVSASATNTSETQISESKIAVAVRLEGYEYLDPAEPSATFQRVSALHTHPHDNQTPAYRPSTRPILS